MRFLCKSYAIPMRVLYSFRASRGLKTPGKQAKPPIPARAKKILRPKTTRYAPRSRPINVAPDVASRAECHRRREVIAFRHKPDAQAKENSANSFACASGLCARNATLQFSGVSSRAVYGRGGEGLQSQGLFFDMSPGRRRSMTKITRRARSRLDRPTRGMPL